MNWTITYKDTLKTTYDSSKYTKEQAIAEFNEYFADCELVSIEESEHYSVYCQYCRACGVEGCCSALCCINNEHGKHCEYYQRILRSNYKALRELEKHLTEEQLDILDSLIEKYQD